MPRGGARPGSGPKPKSRLPVPEDLATLPHDPLSVGLRALKALEAAGKYKEAGTLAAKLAPYFSQPFRASDQTPKPHPEQGMLPLFNQTPKDDAPPADKPGKKEQAQIDAQTAGEGTGWGDDLMPRRPN